MSYTERDFISSSVRLRHCGNEYKGEYIVCGKKVCNCRAKRYGSETVETKECSEMMGSMKGSSTANIGPFVTIYRRGCAREQKRQAEKPALHLNKPSLRLPHLLFPIRLQTMVSVYIFRIVTVGCVGPTEIRGGHQFFSRIVKDKDIFTTS
jgi:hypothetical protein